MKIIDDPQKTPANHGGSYWIAASQLVLFTAADYKLIVGLFVVPASCFPGSFRAEAGIYRVEERRTFLPAPCWVQTGPGYRATRFMDWLD